jgi:hypothetical protein
MAHRLPCPANLVRAGEVTLVNGGREGLQAHGWTEGVTLSPRRPTLSYGTIDYDAPSFARHRRPVSCAQLKSIPNSSSWSHRKILSAYLIIGGCAKCTGGGCWRTAPPQPLYNAPLPPAVTCSSRDLQRMTRPITDESGLFSRSQRRRSASAVRQQSGSDRNSVLVSLSLDSRRPE